MYHYLYYLFLLIIGVCGGVVFFGGVGKGRCAARSPPHPQMLYFESL